MAKEIKEKVINNIKSSAQKPKKTVKKEMVKKEVKKKSIKKKKDKIDSIMTNEENHNESFISKQNKIKLGLMEVFFLLAIVCAIGIAIGILVSKEKEEVTNNDESLNNFVETYQYILDNYYGDAEITKDSLLEAALGGMLDSLDDQNSIFMDQQTSENFNITLEGSYEGLGIEILEDTKTGSITIISVFNDSPAAKAGLLPNDIILKLNDEDVTNQTAAYFSNKVKYGEESSFTLTIKRDNNTFEVSINREKVIIDSVTSNIFERNGKKIGYIYTSIFANNTLNQFKQHLEELESKGIDSLILDFRGNTGGHMYAAREILSLFMDSSYVVYQTEDKNGKIKTYSSGTTTKTYKIALIADSNSASSSEIVIAGLKENLNAMLVGTKTYGKGTVQELQTLPTGSQYKFTIKKWLTPNGNWINKTGIMPDYEIKLDSAYASNPSNDTDNQLQKALDILQ